MKTQDCSDGVEPSKVAFRHSRVRDVNAWPPGVRGLTVLDT
jgi:hypothetical protein